MRTVLYLLRHGATEANLARPQKLQGRRHDLPLAPDGIRQARATRDFLAIRPVDHCYCSPLQRAVQTAAIVAAPHGLAIQIAPDLAECDLGRWEGLDWPTIRRRDAFAYHQFLAAGDDATYPEGESTRQVYERVAATLDDLLTRHEGSSILVVGHDIANYTYLASLMGLAAPQVRQMTLDNCGVSMIVRQNGETRVSTVNAAFHLQGMMAA